MTIGTGTTHATLFDQVGGFDGVDQAVNRLFAGLAAAPDFARLVPAGDTGEARWELQLLLTDLLGGPMSYDGPDPRVVAGRLGVDPAVTNLLLDRAVASFLETGVEPGVATDLRARLAEAARSWSLLPAAAAATSPQAVPAPEVVDPGPALIAAALHEAAGAGVSDWNLFVLDAQCIVIHISATGARAVAACDAELFRAFRVRAAEVMGQPLFRIHPAPTELRAALGDPTRLPRDVSWTFGRVTWKARLFALTGADRQVQGYAVAWHDVSVAARAEAVFERLRHQAEDLPVPVMFPDASLERWHGNAACESALARLAAFLPGPVDPLEGIPIAIFLPDAEERKALFADPEQLPHKRQIRFGPETVSLLIAPVRDEDQRYLGPQVTWEIVHVTRPAATEPVPETAPAAGPPAPRPSPTAPRPASPSLEPPAGRQTSPMAAGAASPTPDLRREARALETAGQELQTLVHLLDAAADDATASPPRSAHAVDAALPEAMRMADAAQTALTTLRSLPGGTERSEGTARTLDQVAALARRTNRLAIEAATLAVEEDARVASDALRRESQALAQGLSTRVRALSQRATEAVEVLRQARAQAARLAELRVELGDAEEA